MSRLIRKTCLKHHHSFYTIDAVISEEGWKTTFLIRMTPLPYAVSSYLLGLTSIRIKDYIIGTFGVIVHVALWVYVGQSFDRLAEIKEKRANNEVSNL